MCTTTERKKSCHAQPLGPSPADSGNTVATLIMNPSMFKSHNGFIWGRLRFFLISWFVTCARPKHAEKHTRRINSMTRRLIRRAREPKSAQRWIEVQKTFAKLGLPL